MTRALSSLRGSSHCWVRALGARLDPGRPPELGWLHTLLSAGSYTPQGRVKERCVWESAAYGVKCRDGRAEFKSERCLLSVDGSTRAAADRRWHSRPEFKCSHKTLIVQWKLPIWRSMRLIQRGSDLVGLFCKKYCNQNFLLKIFTFSFFQFKSSFKIRTMSLKLSNLNHKYGHSVTQRPLTGHIKISEGHWGRGSKRAPHTTSKSAEQTCVHFDFSSYLWQVRDSSSCFNGEVCLFWLTYSRVAIFCARQEITAKSRRSMSPSVTLKPTISRIWEIREERGWIKPSFLFLPDYFVRKVSLGLCEEPCSGLLCRKHAWKRQVICNGVKTDPVNVDFLFFREQLCGDNVFQSK